jgi:CRISPR-associated endonuclease/helicase Cas3
VAFAHSQNSAGLRHDLVEHLRAVAETASRFATGLDAERLAHFAGLWHDLGKFHPEFQSYLSRSEADSRARGHGPDHKAAGAALCSAYFPMLGLLLQGHHGGLRDPVNLRTWLTAKQAGAAVDEALRLARAAMPDLEPTAVLPVPAFVVNDPAAAEMFLRLAFSALVDADFLDTERHFRNDRSIARGSINTLAELWRRFEVDQVSRFAHSTGAVAELRRDVYAHCLAAAEDATGFFRLTVPTGGGKDALRHGLRPAPCDEPRPGARDRRRAVHQHHGADGAGLSRRVRG